MLKNTREQELRYIRSEKKREYNFLSLYLLNPRNDIEADRAVEMVSEAHTLSWKDIKVGDLPVITLKAIIRKEIKDAKYKY